MKRNRFGIKVVFIAFLTWILVAYGIDFFQWISRPKINVLDDSRRIFWGIPTIETGMSAEGWNPEDGLKEDQILVFEMNSRNCSGKKACHISKEIQINDFEVVIESDSYALIKDEKGGASDSLLTISLVLSKDFRRDCPWYFWIYADQGARRIELGEALDYVRRWQVDYGAIDNWLHYFNVSNETVPDANS
jgi:hypothetical protein